MTEARAEAAKLEGFEVNIPAQANEEDTLFGSVTTADVADALNRAGTCDREASDRDARGAHQAARPLRRHGAVPGRHHGHRSAVGGADVIPQPPKAIVLAILLAAWAPSALARQPPARQSLRPSLPPSPGPSPGPSPRARRRREATASWRRSARRPSPPANPATARRAARSRASPIHHARWPPAPARPDGGGEGVAHGGHPEGRRQAP